MNLSFTVSPGEGLRRGLVQQVFAKSWGLPLEVHQVGRRKLRMLK
jgi:hypothetical protein